MSAAKERQGGQVIQLYKRARITMDSWFNEVTGIGTLAKDKLMSAFFRRSVRLSDEQLESMFNGDWLASRIVGKIVDDSLRGGYELVIKVDDETGTNVADAAQMAADMETFMEDDLHATKNVREGWHWGRLFGGGAVFVVTDEGFDIPQDEPLELDRLRAVLALTVLDKRDLIPHTVYDDPSDPKFQEIETYRINTSGPVGHVSGQLINVVVHETRLIIFEGVLTTNREKQLNDGWSLSVLQRPYDVLRGFGQSFQSVMTLLQDASQGIFKMDGFIDMISGGEKETVQTRMALLNLQRSNARSLIIDAEREDFERTVPALTGYPEVLELIMLLASAAADYPFTVLFGRSPAGMNATGESDRLLWAQTVEAQQSSVADPAITRLVDMVFHSSDGPTSGVVPENWDIVFPPLVHQTETEVIANRKTQADTDAIYLREGVVMPEEIALSRFGPTGFSFETTIETTERETMLAEEMARLRVDPTVDPAVDPADPDAPLEVIPEAVDPGTALNGAQIKALQDIAIAAADGTFPKETAIRMIAASFPLSEEEARRILEAIVEPTEPKQSTTPPQLMPFTGEAGPPPAPEPEPDDDREDASHTSHAHSIPGGGQTGVSSVEGAHTHTVPGGGVTGSAQTGAGHTHSLPGGGRTGGPTSA